MSQGVLIAIAVVAVVLGAYAAFTYNRFVSRRNIVDSSWSQIDVQLRKRHDLIPTLVESVRGYAAHERGTLERVTEARGEAVAAEGVAARKSAERELGSATGRLLVVAEDYPELEASANFTRLMDDLRAVEDQIAITRRVYNDTVETYNTVIQVFPALIVARLFGFRAREFFDAPVEAEATPDVDLSPGVSA